MAKMTITFHTKYPNTPAMLTFNGVTNNLTTSAEGDLFWLEIPDGTYPYRVIIADNTYSGTVSVTANTGYVDVTAAPPDIPWLLYALLGGVGAVATYIIWKLM